MNTTLVLHTKFEVQQNHLVLTYEVQNNDSRDVYLLNRIPAAPEQAAAKPDTIYIHLEPIGEIVQLYKKIPDIPKDRNVYMPVSPYVTAVRAHAHFSEQVHIPLPIREHEAYALSTPEAATHPQTYKNVAFTLGYIWSMPGIKEQMVAVGGGSVMVPIAPPEKRHLLEFGQLDSPVHPISLPVLTNHTAP